MFEPPAQLFHITFSPVASDINDWLTINVERLNAHKLTEPVTYGMLCDGVINLNAKGNAVDIATSGALRIAITDQLTKWKERQDAQRSSTRT